LRKANTHLQETGLERRRFYEKQDTACIMQPVVSSKLVVELGIHEKANGL